MMVNSPQLASRVKIHSSVAKLVKTTSRPATEVLFFLSFLWTIFPMQELHTNIVQITVQLVARRQYLSSLRGCFLQLVGKDEYKLSHDKIINLRSFGVVQNLLHSEADNCSTLTTHLISIRHLDVNSNFSLLFQYTVSPCSIKLRLAKSPFELPCFYTSSWGGGFQWCHSELYGSWKSP